ncbi:unnamed protein product, partial [Ectocarpus sp. 12 AP-2014]
ATWFTRQRVTTTRGSRFTVCMSNTLFFASCCPDRLPRKSCFAVRSWLKIPHMKIRSPLNRTLPPLPHYPLYLIIKHVQRLERTVTAKEGPRRRIDLHGAHDEEGDSRKRQRIGSGTVHFGDGACAAGEACTRKVQVARDSSCRDRMRAAGGRTIGIDDRRWKGR